MIDVCDAFISKIAIDTFRVVIMIFKNSTRDPEISQRSRTQNRQEETANSCPNPSVSDRFILGVAQADLACRHLI